MCKPLKKVALLMMTAVMFVSSAKIVNAASATTYIKKGSSYEVHSISTSKIADKSKKVNTPGLKKTSYTSGSIVVSTTKAYTFSASTSVAAEFSVGFGSVTASVEVGASYSTEVSAGTTINLDSNAPNGVYYAYICVPHVKATYKVQSCTLNHTGWYTKYNKTIAYMPMLDMEYLELRKVY